MGGEKPVQWGHQMEKKLHPPTSIFILLLFVLSKSLTSFFAVQTCSATRNSLGVSVPGLSPQRTKLESQGLLLLAASGILPGVPD